MTIQDRHNANIELYGTSRIFRTFSAVGQPCK
jgi:hypothetical protein